VEKNEESKRLDPIYPTDALMKKVFIPTGETPQPP
jgi:hypothetical protein